MRPARERFGPYGKARATSMSFATCEERATPPDGPKRSRPSGCVAFGTGRRCSLGQYRKIQPLRSRLGQHQNRQQRGVHEYFNRLLGIVAWRGMVRAFSPCCFGRLVSWGGAPGWYWLRPWRVRGMLSWAVAGLWASGALADLAFRRVQIASAAHQHLEPR